MNDIDIAVRIDALQRRRDEHMRRALPRQQVAPAGGAGRDAGSLGRALTAVARRIAGQLLGTAPATAAVTPAGVQQDRAPPATDA